MRGEPTHYLRLSRLMSDHEVPVSGQHGQPASNWHGMAWPGSLGGPRLDR